MMSAVELQAPGAKSVLGRCQPLVGSRMSQCLLTPCLPMDGMQNGDEEDKDDNVDGTLPLLPASAILCRRGELKTPVPSSRMSPCVANAATVRRMLGEA